MTRTADRLSLGLIALSAAACAPAQLPAAPVPPPREELTEQEFLERYASCDATPLARFRGTFLDEDLRRNLLTLSGASSVRFVAPGMEAPAAGVAGRLTVELGEDVRILNFYCE